MLRPALDLQYRLRHQLVHLGANRRFGDRDALGGEVADHLADDVGVAGFLEIGGDHFLGIGGGGVALEAELRGDPQAEQLVAAGLRLEFLLLVERVFLLKTVFALVE